MIHLAYTFIFCKRLELVVSGNNNVSLHRLNSETRSHKVRRLHCSKHSFVK